MLLEGGHQSRAFAREVDAARELHEALKDREERWKDAKVDTVLTYEMAGDSAFERYDRAVAMAFLEGLRAQGGAEITRMAL